MFYAPIYQGDNITVFQTYSGKSIELSQEEMQSLFEILIEIALNIGYVLGFLKEASTEYNMEFKRVFEAVKFSSEGLVSYIQPLVV